MRWGDEEKQAIIEESKTAPVARVAKKHGVATSLLFRWRKQQGIGSRRPPTDAGFVRVALPAPAVAPVKSSPGSIEIVLGSGRRVVVNGEIDAVALRRVIEALES
jgi:transposase